MLTRHLNIKQGLINGQKAIIVRGFSSRIAHVEPLDESSSLVLTPRVRFKVKAGKNGISFSRLQLPLRVCHAVTINKKSQGWTLSKIGIGLRNDVVTHGQLYVALSRAQKREPIIMCLALPARLRGAPNKYSCAFVHNTTFPQFIYAACHRLRHYLFSPRTSTLWWLHWLDVCLFLLPLLLTNQIRS